MTNRKQRVINIINDFMTNRKQRIVLNGQCSPWVDIQAGVPQGSILGHLLFLYMSMIDQISFYLLITHFYFP